MAPNVPSIYGVATEGSNVPKGEYEAQRVHAVLGDASPYDSIQDTINLP